MEGKCVAGPGLTRAQVKKTLKVKEAVSSVEQVYHRRCSEEGFYSEEML